MPKRRSLESVILTINLDEWVSDDTWLWEKRCNSSWADNIWNLESQYWHWSHNQWPQLQEVIEIVLYLNAWCSHHGARGQGARWIPIGRKLYHWEYYANKIAWWLHRSAEWPAGSWVARNAPSRQLRNREVEQIKHCLEPQEEKCGRVGQESASGGTFKESWKTKRCCRYKIRPLYLLQELWWQVRLLLHGSSSQVS